MADHEAYDKQYYLDSFDARKYVEQFYGAAQWTEEKIANSASGFCMKNVQKFLPRAQCDKSDRRFLDIGTGACVANLIPAATKFDQIYSADLSPSSRGELEKWRAGEPDAIDWTGYFKYGANLDGQPENWKTYETALHKNLKAALSCDMMHEDPLALENFMPVDVLTESFLLCSIAKDSQDLGNYIRRMSRYLKNGGTLILSECVNASFYRVNGRTLYICNLSEGEYVQALENNGFTQIEVARASDANFHEDQEFSNIGDDVTIKAVKEV